MSTILIRNHADIDFARPGKQHYQVAFHLDGAWGYSLVPLTVINGLLPAPEGMELPGVAVIGGTHGDEYEGQVAVKRLGYELDPARMSGCVILIPQLSESACRAGKRCSPLDGVNMNRAFPGDPRGTLSSRIAAFLKRTIFPRVRVVLDLHSGGDEDKFAHLVSFHEIPDARQRAETAEVAALFDTPFIFLYSKDMASGLLTDEAEGEGKITIGTELGCGSSTNPVGVRHAYEGVKNVLRHYGMLDGEIARVAPERAAAPRFVRAPHLDSYAPCPCDGIWEPLVEPGVDVKGGELIGRIHDFDDHSSAPLEIRAHRSGVLIAMFYRAVCAKGLTLFVIGEEAPLPCSDR
ncbi:MAG: succinylglutamate desuccinylase/aspartoacylase family protein [Acidobacteria bacterium]|nr:succinylglutamate desuccinylase/aspartoacylase family protein [Acidobacteriota bacterium]